MNKQQTIDQLYGIKDAVGALPKFNGRAKMISQVISMIRFLNRYCEDGDVNQKFINQAEHLLMRAHAIVDGLSTQQDQRKIFG
jgi:hypothetical protein